MTKVSDLTALTTVDDADLVDVVDVSDTSMAGTGTNKKVTAADLALYVIAEGLAATGVKMTDLTAQTAGGLVTTDIMETVDLSDTSMAASGTNKKLTLANLITFLAANGVSRRTLNAQTGTTYTPALTDEGLMVTLSNASAITVSLPQDSAVAFPTGAEVDFLWLGVGACSFAQGTGATIVSSGTSVASPAMRIRYSAATAKKIAANTWLVAGDLA